MPPVTKGWVCCSVEGRGRRVGSSRLDLIRSNLVRVKAEDENVRIPGFAAGNKHVPASGVCFKARRL